MARRKGSGRGGPGVDTMREAAAEFARRMIDRLVEEHHAGRNEWGVWTIPQLNVRIVECVSEYFSGQSSGAPVGDQQRMLINIACYALIHFDLLATRGAAETACLIPPLDG